MVSSSFDGCVDIAYGAVGLPLSEYPPTGKVRMLFVDNSLMMFSFNSAKFSGDCVSDLAISGIMLVKSARRLKYSISAAFTPAKISRCCHMYTGAFTL